MSEKLQTTGLAQDAM